MTEVAGRTAFITGGANGIGLGIARSLAQAGAKLALADLDGGALDRARSALSAITEVETVVLDVRDRDAFSRAADAVEAKLGAVSLLFNNAGVAGGAPTASLSYALWDWSLGINLGGVVNGAQTFVPRMIANGGGGHIVNTASGAGLAATSSGLLYCTAKFAVVGLSETLRLELAPLRIGVSVLCPGPVATDIIARSGSLRPEGGVTLTEAQQRKVYERTTMMTAILQQGVAPDQVGAMVLEAIAEDRLYIHTDRMMIPYIEARTKALLDAMPAA